MPRLVKNVWVGDRGYGPGFGPDLPPPDADLPDWVWADDDVEHVLPEVPAPAGGDDPGGAPTVAPEAAGDLDALTRDELVSLARGRGIQVDGRWGAPRLRREIRAVQP